MSNITLYHAPRACSIVCMAVLKELGVPFNLRLMSFGPSGIHSKDGSLSPEQYRARVHPQGRVPALQVDDQVITELPAILSYITSIAADQKLAESLWGGSDPIAKARVLEWCFWISGHVHTLGLGMLVRPERFVRDKTELYPVISEQGREVLQAAHGAINEKLEGASPFAVGGAMTIVDFYLSIFWYWGAADGFAMNGLNNWANLVKKVEERGSWREALMTDGLKPCFSE